MKKMYNDSGNLDVTLLLLVLVALIAFLIVISLYIKVILPFSENRRYIIMEMRRSEGREYRYWKRKLKLLYISKIPIVGNIICRKLK